MEKRLVKYSVFVLTLLLGFVIFFAFAKPVDYLAIIPENYEGANVTIFEEVDEFGFKKIKLNEDRDFKIMQLTDIHLGYGILSRRCDELAISAVVKLVLTAKPDVIVVTGDFLFTNFFLTGTTNNFETLKVFCKIMESFKTPWTVTFGNHDDEGSNDKSFLSAYLSSPALKYCVYSFGDIEIKTNTENKEVSYGNHAVNLYNSNNTLNSSLIMLDSNGHFNNSQLQGYEKIESEQVDWFQSVLDSLPSNTPNHVFYHIPQTEYKDAWQLYKNNSDEVKYFFGTAGERGEKISTPVYKSLLFEKMQEKGTTKSVFCGHNHMNNFSVEYKNIRLTFGLSIDYLAYLTISNKTEQRGATLLHIKKDRSFEISQLLLVDC